MLFFMHFLPIFSAVQRMICLSVAGQVSRGSSRANSDCRFASLAGCWRLFELVLIRRLFLAPSNCHHASHSLTLLFVTITTIWLIHDVVLQFVGTLKSRCFKGISGKDWMGRAGLWQDEKQAFQGTGYEVSLDSGVNVVWSYELAVCFTLLTAYSRVLLIEMKFRNPTTVL